MRFSGKTLMCLFMMVIAVGAVITALQWKFATALFPVIIGIFVFIIATAGSLMTLFGREENEIKHAAVDFELSQDSDQALAIRRTLLIFVWVIGFFLLILFFGFLVAVPLFVFLYLKLQGREGWGISLILMGLSLVFFYGLFVWLLHIPFLEGWVLKGLRMLVVVNIFSNLFSL